MSLWEYAKRLEACTVVDLTHRLNNDSPYWGGVPEGSVDLCRTVFDYDNEMLHCRIHTYMFPGQFGTHIDFPVHFEADMPAAEAFGPSHMVYPLVVIDVSDRVAHDEEYAITIEDIVAFEEEHGVIPAGSFVALRTDWYKRWPDNDALNNFDVEGGEHCPGWSLPALEFLYEQRGIAANGHETFDTDASPEAVAADDLACERYVLANGHLQVELMANLDKVPATGALLFVAWPNIEGATGLPVRAVAVFE